jgi:pimeloyl-ACP methyl ester carboxylesterase
MIAVLCIASLMKLCGGGQQGQQLQSSLVATDSPMDSQYLRRSNFDTVIVFVHGVFGGARGTWTNPVTGAYWPDLLLGDDTFKGADVYVYSYTTPYLAQTYTIDELIENMRLVFDNAELFKTHKHVIFVCHSMGGIVIRGYLKRYQANAAKVQLISFYSTPTAGAHVTKLAQFLSNNPQLRGMLPANADNYVSDLERDWRALPYRVLSHCAYEIKDTYGIRIVDEQSASALCDGPVDPLNRNHIDIVKPADRQDLVYTSFRQAFLDSFNSTSQAEPLVTGVVQTDRSVDVNCGETREATALIAPPIGIQPEQRIVDAVASLQEASNLKEEDVEAKGLENSNAKVHYRLVGLDRRPDGGCPTKGYGVILVSFIVNQPRSFQVSNATFTQVGSGDMFLALSAKSGTISIRRLDSVPKIDAAEKSVAAVPRMDLMLKLPF